MSADDDRAAFVAWIRDDGYLVPDAVTPIEWDDEGLPVYYTLHDGERRYLDGEWHGWQAAIAAEREACLKVTPASPDYERHAQTMVELGHQGVADIARLAEGAFGDGVSRTLAAIRARGAS